MPVNTRCSEYMLYADRWFRISDALKGAFHIKEQAAKYLPLLDEERETDSSYKLRKSLAKWYDAPARTVEMLTGMIMRKEVIVSASPKLEDVLKDFTLTGTDINTFTSRVVSNVITYARFGVLVDFHVGLKRPYAVGYDPTQIINWRTASDGNGRVYLDLVVLAEIDATPAKEDFFVTEYTERYRVLALDEDGYYYQQVWRQNAEGTEFSPDDPIYPEAVGTKLNRIPFTFFGKADLETDIERSPIEAIADLAYHYYQLAADFFWGLHFTALPTPVQINAGEGAPSTLGPQHIWELNGEGASAMMLTFSGDGMRLLFEAGLEADKKEMADLGARILETKGSSNVSAKTVEIKSFTDSASLSSISSVVGAGLTEILILMHSFMNISEPDVDVLVNNDFLPDPVDPAMLRELVAAAQSGAITSQELFEQLQKGEIIPSDKTFEEHLMEKEADEERLGLKLEPAAGQNSNEADMEQDEDTDTEDDQDEEN